MSRAAVRFAAALVLAGCIPVPTPNADAGPEDAGPVDAGPDDAGPGDSGLDAGHDSGSDAEVDAGLLDAGRDADVDAETGSDGPAPPVLEGYEVLPSGVLEIYGYTTPSTAVSLYGFNDGECVQSLRLGEATSDAAGNLSIVIPDIRNDSSTFEAKITRDKHSRCYIFGHFLVAAPNGLAAPEFQALVPASGADANDVSLHGVARPAEGMQLLLFENNACTEDPIQIVDHTSESELVFEAHVPDDSTTTFYMQARKGRRLSPCSDPIVYIEDSSPLAVAVERAAARPGYFYQYDVRGKAARGALVTFFLQDGCEGDELPSATVTTDDGSFESVITMPADARALIFSVLAEDAAFHKRRCVRFENLDPLNRYYPINVESIVKTRTNMGPDEAPVFRYDATLNGSLRYGLSVEAFNDYGCQGTPYPATFVADSALWSASFRYDYLNLGLSVRTTDRDNQTVCQSVGSLADELDAAIPTPFGISNVIPADPADPAAGQVVELQVSYEPLDPAARYTVHLSTSATCEDEISPGTSDIAPALLRLPLSAAFDYYGYLLSGEFRRSECALLFQR
jgi:hypothetical protein